MLSDRFNNFFWDKTLEKRFKRGAPKEVMGVGQILEGEKEGHPNGIRLVSE